MVEASQLASPVGATCLALGFLPIIAFLAALVLLDSYALVKPGVVLSLLGYGLLAAMASLMVNPRVQMGLDLEFEALARYWAPVIEESFKGIIVVWALRKRRVGFLVDTAIFGFAVGAGFAVVENVHYFLVLGKPEIAIWMIRGFGTAVMHGGATSLFGILAKHLSELYDSDSPWVFLPGFALAVGIHSFYNHFYFSPALSALGLLVVLPILFVAIFRVSEKATQEWLGVGFDTDQELLQTINEGTVSETRVGHYLQELKGRLPPTTVSDMLCLIRLHLELSIQAKGLLIMQKAGFSPPADPTAEEKFAELRYLESSIGRTGLRALHPIFHTDSRDLWKLHLLRAPSPPPGRASADRPEAGNGGEGR